MNENIYIIIPGFGEHKTDYPYKKLAQIIKKNNPSSNIKYYNPIWDRKTIKNWLEDFEKNFKNIDASQITLIGFSMGSYISILLAEKYAFKKVLLASLSPYFGENIEKLPKEAISFMGKKRMLEFSKTKIPEKLKAGRVTFMFGEKDWPMAKNQAEKISKKYKGRFFIIKNTAHELNHYYINKIAEEV